ncbi:hypothetical protein D3C85_805950 [compost metagenome]
MPSSSRLTELCRYHYDPLDRQAGCTLTLLQPATLQRFYCKSRLATEIQGAVGTHLFQHDDQLLAQHRHQNDKVDTTLLATDQQRSVLSALDTTRPHPLAYTPYGHRPAESGLLSLLGFNGERPDPITGCYHLGNGYRQFNPVLMRFNSPDSWSPFGQGGLNAYAYCEGEPVLGSDPTGHFKLFKVIRSFGKGIGNRLGLRTLSNTKSSTSVFTKTAGATRRSSDTPAQLPPNPNIASSQTLTSMSPANSEANTPNLVRKLNKLKGTPAHSTSLSTRAHGTPNNSTNHPAPSAFTNSAEHSTYAELLQQENAISAWAKEGAEGDRMLSIIKQEKNRRFPQYFGEPPISNREIRKGEPGFD